MASRRGEFLSGLHHPTALLLLARQLVEGALTAFQKAAAAGRPPAARRKVLEEGALRVGMQLALVAQRLGESHTLRRGLLGWGSQQVSGAVGVGDWVGGHVVWAAKGRGAGSHKLWQGLLVWGSQQPSGRGRMRSGARWDV